jgi:hypothetical protein
MCSMDRQVCTKAGPDLQSVVEITPRNLPALDIEVVSIVADKILAGINANGLLGRFCFHVFYFVMRYLNLYRFPALRRDCYCT